MVGVSLDGSEQPIDPKLVLAIESVFRRISMTTVPFVAAPRAWAESNPTGGSKGPQGLTKAYRRLEIAKRDGSRCAYCAQEFLDLDDATLDHVIPNSIVGHWQAWNLVLACGPCNNLKGDRLPAFLMPMLCHLITSLAPVSAVLGEQQRAAAAELRRQNKRARKARYKVQRRERLASRRREVAAAIEALAGRPIRRAIEAPKPRLALPAGGE